MHVWQQRRHGAVHPGLGVGGRAGALRVVNLVIAPTPNGHHVSQSSCRRSRNSVQADSGSVQDSTSVARRQTAGWDSLDTRWLANDVVPMHNKHAVYRRQVSLNSLDAQQRRRCPTAQPSHSCSWRQHPQHLAVTPRLCRCSSDAAVRHSTGGLRAGRWTSPGRKAAEAAVKQQQPVEHQSTRTTTGRRRHQVPA